MSEINCQYATHLNKFKPLKGCNMPVGIASNISAKRW